MLPLPHIALTASDYPRLEQTARVAAQKGDMDAILLLAEINRAEIVPDDAHDVERRVTIGSWVTYSTDWWPPRKTVQLVWPEDLASDLAQISVLSGLGAALLGLRAGDRMPYFAGCMNVIRVEAVNRAEPSTDPLAPLLRASAYADDDDDDPGPTAA